MSFKDKLPTHRLEQPQHLLFSQMSKQEDQQEGIFFKKWQKIRENLRKYSGSFFDQYRENNQEVINSRHDNFHFQKAIESRNTVYPLMEFDSFMKNRAAKPAMISFKNTLKKNSDILEQKFLQKSKQKLPEDQVQTERNQTRRLPKLKDINIPYETSTSFSTDINHRIFSPTSTFYNRKQLLTPGRKQMIASSQEGNQTYREQMMNTSLPSPFTNNLVQLASPTFSIAPKSPSDYIFTPEKRMFLKRELPKSFITQRKTPDILQSSGGEIKEQQSRTTSNAQGFVRFQTSINMPKATAEVPTNHVVYLVPDSFNPARSENIQFCKINLAAEVAQFFPSPGAKALHKEPKGSVISYGRLVQLHERSREYQEQCFHNLIERFSQKLNQNYWEEVNPTESKSLARLKKKSKEASLGYKHLYRLDGDAIQNFSDLCPEIRVIVLSQYSRYTGLQGVEELFDEHKVMTDREEMVRNMLGNRAGLWYHSTKEKMKEDSFHQRQLMQVYGGGSYKRKMTSLERKKKLIDLASDDLKNRINKMERKTSQTTGRGQQMLTEEDQEQDIQQNFEESLAAYLEKIEFQRKLATQRSNDDAHSLIMETDEETEGGVPPRSPDSKRFSGSPVHLESTLKKFQKSSTFRANSQPKKVSTRFSPPPPPLILSRRDVKSSLEKQKDDGERKLKTPKIMMRQSGFETQKMKEPSLHMSIDFGGKFLTLCREKNPIIPTPAFRDAPLELKNRDDKGWSCSSKKYKRIKMTKRDMKALNGLLNSSSPLSPIHSKHRIETRSSRANSISPPPLIQLHEETRGLKFKDIEEFREKYSLARKEIFSIKSRFMSLNRMSKAGDMASVDSPINGITLGQFLHTSPLVKDLIPKVASRVIQALGVDPGNLGLKIEWKKYVELYCILTQSSTSLTILSKFWIKYFDPQGLGVLHLDTLIELLEDLLRGKSEGAHAWIVHHFSGNFIKRLVMDEIVDLEKKTVNVFKLEEKFKDVNAVSSPMMLSKATGMHEFEDVFKELNMTHEQEKIFDKLMTKEPVPTPKPPRRTDTSFSVAPPPSSQAFMRRQASVAH